jgi:aspartate racemase
MKTIGFIGGLTWHSSADYYRLLNEMVNEKLSGAHSCQMIMYSVDFDEIKALTFAEDWDGIADIMCSIAKKLQQTGADCIMLGANTMHNVAHKVQAAVSIPLIHIAEATAVEIEKKGLSKVALLGTRYTMQMDFYKNKLAEKNISTIIPNENDIDFINHAVYEEMGKGLFLPETKQRVIQIINSLKQNGAEGVILGCTELPILIKQGDIMIPAFDTTLIHARAAVNFALK